MHWPPVSLAWLGNRCSAAVLRFSQTLQGNKNSHFSQAIDGDVARERKTMDRTRVSSWR
ncbi:hypothetical protein EC9_05210 [Rosistilla ulvae]|uniref:Uncharacterized protein n=1 Tax=Rosistilla ulvae TaxID=1930277 RepID=A0A517LUR1_9BACT|nr:hypothetical protein EC9_05210 [Rosistilla ulvae]